MVKTVRFVTDGGINGTHNVYYSDWTCVINSRQNVSSYEKTTFSVVLAAYETEHPDEEEEEI